MSVLRYTVCLIWAVSLVVALPIVGVNTLQEADPKEIICDEKWPKPQYRTVYNLVSFALTYAVPLFIMCLLFINIAITLNKVVRDGANREGFTNQKKKDKVVKILLALIIAYATCFLPHHVIYMWREYGNGNKSK